MKYIYTIISVLVLCQFAWSQPNTIIAYQYWINSDFANQTTVSITPEEHFHLQTDLNISGMEKGFHSFNIRFQDQNLKYSAVLTQLFYAKANGNNITAYEYWFDNDYANKVNVVLSPQTQLSLISNFDCSLLTNGMHRIHIRFLDDGDKWSSVVSQFFQKSANGSSALNKITAYRYWIDSAYAEITTVSLSTAQNPYHFLQDFDFTAIPKGEHLFNIQFKDTAGYWSSVLTDTVVKNALPIANFTYTANSTCDSTVVDLTNLSFDGDTYSWDFGNGNFSSDSLPKLTYYSPGTYMISLTLTDSNSGLDSTVSKEIVVMGPSSNALNMAECFQAISPSGLYIWTQSGTYADTLMNHFGCDSLLTVSLTINTIDASATDTANTLSATLAGATYQWIDCNNGNQAISGATGQSFTPIANGLYAVIVNDGTCSDTSSCLLVDDLKVDEIIYQYGINVFPNPTKDYLNVSIAKANTLSEIRILDLTGRVLLTTVPEKSSHSKFDISSFSDGIYLLEIEIDNKISQIKFIKN